ncbi:MAG: Na/Pi symporter [Bacteroidota bacterium]
MNRTRSIFILLFLVLQVQGQDSASILKPPAEGMHRISLLGNELGKRSGICGHQLQDPVMIRVTDLENRPVQGVSVAFSIISAPDSPDDSQLSARLVTTDSTGSAGTYLTLGSKPGKYQVSCRIREGFPDNEVIFRATANGKNWVYMLLIGLLGGLGLFLFGMHAMSEGMQRSAGERMRSILGSVTRNRIVGVGVGTLVTTIIQSSSATSVMLVSFVNARLIKFRQTLPVLLGAAIGTTITAQMIAFRITEYSLLLVAIGFFLQAFSNKEQWKSVGTSLFGFGILFFGMQIMSNAMAPLREWTPFIDLLLKLENPVLGILAGALFTALIQSSSAFVGIMIVLASQGLLSLDASIPLLLGSNLGTTVTALLSSMKANREAKKVALAFLLIKFISVLIFAGWTVRLGEMVKAFSPDAPLARLIANSHTLINVVLMVVVLPFTPQIARLTDWLMGKAKDQEPSVFATRYLDKGLLSTPSLALNLAKQEIIRMGKIVQTMFSLVLQPLLKKDPSSLDAVYTHEQEVNFLMDSIKDYLLKINREMLNSERVNESFQMLYTMNEFEKIADIISGSLANRAERWVVRDFDFSEAGKEEIRTYHSKVGKQLIRALVVFEETNLQEASRMKAKHEEYRSLSQDLERLHYGRILDGMKESIESSKTHVEILALLSTIDTHATNIARIALDWYQKAN